MNVTFPNEQRITDGRAVLVHTHRREAGEEKTLHSHPEGQIWAVQEGLVTAELAEGSWILPQGRIGWIPPGTVHAAKVFKTAIGWMAYLRPDLCESFPDHPAVFEVTALSSALLDKISGWEPSTPHLSPSKSRLLAVLVDELLASQTEPMYLPMPRNSGLLKMSLAIAADPSDKRTISDWALYCGISERGLTRHFRLETGMSLVQWRTLARMKRALELLEDDMSVTTTALEVGYESLSSFVSAFRRTFGVTPSKYYKS
ncbi:AraC family transcriptional regulator [Undibacterium sp. SXout20W]